MKNILTISVFALIFGVLAFGIDTTNASEPSISERFGPNKSLVAPMSGTYQFDPAHSAIGFKVVHMGLVNVPGYFKEFTGSVNYNAEDVKKSSVEFSAKTASVDTRVEARNNHLKTADFFDVENHPDMKFKSTKVVVKDKKKNILAVTGDFTLRGVTKSITIPVRVAGFKEGRGGSTTMGVMAETSIKRSEYGVNYGISTGAVSDEVAIELNIEAGMKKEEK